MGVNIDSDLLERVRADVRLLNQDAALDVFPEPHSLRDALNAVQPKGTKKHAPARNLTPETAKMFTTAAVDMWLRGVHSFLISGSLTTVSPIWASVTGYYSSHYCVRALAHLLGFFRLFSTKRMARLLPAAGRYSCDFSGKTGREHDIYWGIVKSDPHFASDALFPASNLDVDHRDWANYADHLPRFVPFRPLDKEALKIRIERISEIPFASPPTPSPKEGGIPDVDNVQVLAYHRVVRFREFVDGILVGKNRFWDVHRNPSWAMEFMDFQLTEGRTLHSEFTIS